MNIPARADMDAAVDTPASMLSDVVAGLSACPKRLPSKYFYDDRGSQLFEQICEQPEYDLTRNELEIMRVHGQAIGTVLGESARIVEYGSGSGIKTRLLLSHARDAASYVPVEISEAALDASVRALEQEFPELELLPLAADFTQSFDLPKGRSPFRRTVIYFPGSTIGNFGQAEAVELLRNMRATVGPAGGALIGIDLKKSIKEMEAAYNDVAGVTAEFTLNLLSHLNREVATNFDLSAFVHRARYDEANSRIETSLVSLRRQVVSLGEAQFFIGAGEAIGVEYSHKYSLRAFAALCAQAGFQAIKHWTDPAARFAVVYLTPCTSTELSTRGPSGQSDVVATMELSN